MFKTKKLLVFFCIFILSLNSCGFYKRSDVKDNPVNVEERTRKNVQEGRGIRFGKGATRGGDFDFASSNSLWRASVEILDFVPLTNASYSGGIIITDWFSSKKQETNNSKELKITVRFLSNEVQSNSIKVIVHNKKCKTNENCAIDEIDSNIKFELQKSILAKAAQFERESKKSKK